MDMIRPIRVASLAAAMAVATSLVGGASAAEQQFHSRIDPIDPALTARMKAPTGSWHEGCPVPIADLRHVTVSYYGFDDAVHQGELVVAADVAPAVVKVLGELYRARFPIERMSLVEEFAGNDDDSMAADNSSGFNCRRGGSDPWSQHAWGHAIDLNPLVNPVVGATRVRPPAGTAFLDRTRTDVKGMILPGSVPVTQFRAIGWHWGGNWRSSKDFQHFSLSGR
jgi:hypothetical protein